MQDRPWNFEYEEDSDPCDHHFIGQMFCIYCNEKWSNLEFEGLLAEVIELRVKVFELESLLKKELK